MATVRWISTKNHYGLGGSVLSLLHDSPQSAQPHHREDVSPTPPRPPCCRASLQDGVFGWRPHL